jgi:uncharacterized membrane protein
MIRKSLLFLCLLFVVLLAAPRPALAATGAAPASQVRAEAPVVRCLLFYSPTCPHCHQVITEDLPPLIAQYGDQLLILGIDTSHPQGQELYQAAITAFKIPETRRGVPTLIIGDAVLVGSLEIPQQLPPLVAAHLERGGLEWPAIPGLAAMLPDTETGDDPPAAPTAAESTATVEAVAANLGDDAAAEDLLYPMTAAAASPSARFARDPTGNSLSLLVLLGMVGLVAGSVTHVARAPRRQPLSPPTRWRSWLLPLLVSLGLVVSAYMALVETTETVAVCGPVGDCNTVQQSEYARLFGVLPIGVLGIVGYLTLGLAWAVATFWRDPRRRWALATLFVLAFAGTLFSIYLTFLEPFVIGATCLWCLSSALIMSLILLLTTGPGSAALFERKPPAAHGGARQPQE